MVLFYASFGFCPFLPCTHGVLILWHAPGGYSPSLGLTLPDRPFSKDIANRGLYTALAAPLVLTISVFVPRRIRQ